MISVKGNWTAIWAGMCVDLRDEEGRVIHSSVIYKSSLKSTSISKEFGFSNIYNSIPICLSAIKS